jgi:hypothetical protein
MVGCACLRPLEIRTRFLGMSPRGEIAVPVHAINSAVAALSIVLKPLRVSAVTASRNQAVFFSGFRTTISLASDRRRSTNATNAARERLADTATTQRPIGPISRPNASGASAWQIRDGAPITPSR